MVFNLNKVWSIEIFSLLTVSRNLNRVFLANGTLYRTETILSADPRSVPSGIIPCFPGHRFVNSNASTGDEV